MKLLSVPEFLEHKTHDGLAILGSGFSINWITQEEWLYINGHYDTWAMNWFCKSLRPTTWYLIREQCTVPKRCLPGYELDDFYYCMSFNPGSIKIVKNMDYRVNNFQHTRHLEFFDGAGRVFEEIHGGCSVKSFRDDIFEEGIHHGKCSIYDALHFATGMGYKRILFCGVDLYDNRYCYLPFDQTMPQTLSEGKNITDKHGTADKVVKLVADFVAYYPEIKCSVQNKRSLLYGIVPLWREK